MHFIVYRLEPSKTRPGKTEKIPVDHRTGHTHSPMDPAIWTTQAQATAAAIAFGPAHGVGLIVTPGLWFLDIDNCLQADNTWSPLALELCQRLAGAYVEVSASGKGLHLIGRGVLPPHGSRNGALGLELYTGGRFCALTGTSCLGDMAAEIPAIQTVAAQYFPAGQATAPADWTDGPCEGWSGTVDDDVLIAKMLEARSAASVFGGKPSVRQLWEADETVLGQSFPDANGRAYDASAADAALAQHLAFWTGKDCTRIDRLMRRSALARDKWERADYMFRTITRACGQQREVFGSHKVEAPVWKATAGADADTVGPTNKSTILVKPGELDRVATEGEQALIEMGADIYQRGGCLVRPYGPKLGAEGDESDGYAGIHKLSEHALVDEFSQVATWVKIDGRSNETKRIDPPADVAKILLTRVGLWDFKTLDGVIRSPTLRKDGSLLSDAGYDPATRLRHFLDPKLKLDPGLQRPTREMAEQALVLLATLLEEFPFVDLGADADGHISRAVALSALITLAVRPSMDIVPMHVISAADAGTGKGYLLDIAAAISVGRTCPVIAASTSAEEREKKITAKLLDGSQILNLDNINGELGGDLLCQTVTQKTLELRPLGTSTNVSIENRVTTFANGNNIRVSGDMVRRVLLCYMNANVERPELRKFKGWPFEAVLADRGKYLSACLMIPMAYNAAGMPGRLPPIASFVEWSDKVRSALVWLGCADPATSMERVRADDPVINEIGEVMQAWADAFGGEGHTVAELVALAGSRVAGTPDSPAMPNKRPELWELLNRLFGERGVINTKRLGKWLRDKEGRVVGDRCFVRRAGSTRNGAVRWALEATR